MTRIDNIQISAYRATDDVLRCEAFIEAHQTLLRRYKIEKVAENSNGWISDPDVVVIEAVHEELGLVGGMRIHASMNNVSKVLPITNTFKTIEPKGLSELLNRLQDEGVAEYCALWNSMEFRNRKLATFLIKAGHSIIPTLGAGNALGFVAHYALRYALETGFEVDTTFGHGGKIAYPRPGISAFVVTCNEKSLNRSASPKHRQDIQLLRSFGAQTIHEHVFGHELIIDYELRIPEKKSNKGVDDSRDAQ